jgi:mono/diheme cytochrome c family protein
MTKKVTLWAFGAVLLLAAILIYSQGLRQGAARLLPYQDTAAIAQGRQIYLEYCAACHGVNLRGEPDWRRRDSDGYLPAPPHDAQGHTWHHPDEQLIAITTLGTEAIVGGGYKSRMIGFGDTLSSDEIRNVLAYIKSTWPAEIIDRHNQINAGARN